MRFKNYCQLKLLIGFLGLAFTISLVHANSVFYEFEVMAQSGMGGIVGISPETSINDLGQVAFIGQETASTTSFESVYVASGAGAPLTNYSTNFSTSKREFVFPQINNSGLVVCRDRVPGAPPSYLVRTWNSAGSFKTLAYIFGGNPVTLPGISNDGLFSYVELDTLSTPSLTYINLHDGTAATRVATFTNAVLRPQMGDGGRIVVRAGNTPNDPIQLIDGPRGVLTIAAAPGYAGLGQSSGISSDGLVVAFYGELSDAGAVALNTAQTNVVNQLAGGAGIFVSVDIGGGNRSVFRLASLSGVLGSDTVGAAVRSVGFASFQANTRVGVTHLASGAAGLADDSIVVCFMGTNSAASTEGLYTQQLGIWSVRATLRAENAKLSLEYGGAMPVAQIGDAFGSNTVTSLTLYDPIALPAQETNGSPRTPLPGEHLIAFWAGFASGNAIIRASYLDTDGDCLPDHWERDGITVNGQFINLPALGADARHKDLFIHADWMVNTNNIDFRPSRRDSILVTDAFMMAPVNNPDGSDGINLHIDSGPNSPLGSLQIDDWGTNSHAGEIAFKEVIGAFNGAGEYIWSEVDAAKTNFFIPSGRSLVFHYCLFANDYEPVNHSSGISRGVPASDFLVTLGRWRVPGGTPNQRAGTMMHEFGHNLGLRHGGRDHVNFKPNYLSIMNYSFQTIGLIEADNHRSFDYSTRILPTLDETHLSETAGISDPDGHRTLWMVSNKCLTNNSYNISLGLPALDWDCNGTNTSGLVSIRISGGTAPDEVTPIFQILSGATDWTNLVFGGGGSIGGTQGGVDSAIPPATPYREASMQEILNIVPPGLFEAQLHEPTDDARFSPRSGKAPLQVSFDGRASSDPDGTIVSYNWDFGDGATAAGAVVSHTYLRGGIYDARLNLVDNDGLINSVRMAYRVKVTEGLRLTALITSDAVILSWPADSSGFRLETSVAIGEGALWIKSSATITTTNGVNSASLPPQDAARYFRLAKP